MRTVLVTFRDSRCHGDFHGDGPCDKVVRETVLVTHW